MQELTDYFLSILGTTVKTVNSICIPQHKQKETENSSLYGVPSQKLGHLGQSLIAGICEICGLPMDID